MDVQSKFNEEDSMTEEEIYQQEGGDSPVGMS
jgi:hypothetical protein